MDNKDNTNNTNNKNNYSINYLYLCSLKQALTLCLIAHFILILFLLFNINFNINIYVHTDSDSSMDNLLFLMVKQVVSEYALHSIWLTITVLSSLPVLCYLFNKNKYNKIIYPIKYIGIIIPVLISLIVSWFQSILFFDYKTGVIALFTVWHILLMIKAGLLMFLMSSLWVLYLFNDKPMNDVEPIAVLEEANLQHLGAAIRPHFFFNALNAVMGLIRTQPKHAEDVLLDTAELFRSVMMQHEHRLVSLSTELETCEQYIRIETARLSERLNVVWTIDKGLLGVSIPPFCIQPLIENAIRYGIEPNVNGGEVKIIIERHGETVIITVINPYIQKEMLYHHNNPVQHGNGIALNNIQKRLQLMYDKASLFNITIKDNYYIVQITLPLEYI